MHVILRYFLMLLLFLIIKAKTGNVTKQENTIQTRTFQNNSKKAEGEFITAKIVYDIKPGGKNENIFTVNDIPVKSKPVNNISVNNISLNNKPVKMLVHHAKNKQNTDLQHQRMSRLAGTSLDNIECVSCLGAGITTNDELCYSGETSSKAKCGYTEACFTELHPQYIKRGCILPSNLNRTFVCKCPLCNDKPAEDVTYYEYKTISDWQFDNERLEEPLLGMDLLCKVCETTGRNRVADKICTNGSRADYMLCGHNQLCYTNIIHQLNYVSRGCIEPPAYNSLYFLCNSSSCNTQKHDNSARIKKALEINLLKGTRRSSSATMMITIKHFLMCLHFLVFFLKYHTYIY